MTYILAKIDRKNALFYNIYANPGIRLKQGVGTMGFFKGSSEPVDISRLPQNCEFCGGPNGYMMLDGVRVYGCGNDHSGYLAVMPAQQPRRWFLGLF